MKNKIIRNAFGNVLHWYRTDNDFTWSLSNFEHDEDNGRCYQLVPSENMSNSSTSGALVRRRISKSLYLQRLCECKIACGIE